MANRILRRIAPRAGGSLSTPRLDMPPAARILDPASPHFPIPETVMQTFRRSALLCSALLAVAACATKEQPAQDTTKAAAAAPAPAPPPVTLADFAGKWAVVATPESGKDTTSTKYTLTATADTTGWVIEFPSGVKVPSQVMLSGDSLHLKTGQFA